MPKTSLLMFVLCLSCVLGAAGQSISGSMAGRIVDQQGAVVANASVTVTDPDKNVTSNIKTGDNGTFNFSALQPGTYNLTVEITGFKKLERNSIPLNAEDKLALGDLPMQVGAVTETLEVSAQAALVQSESAERSATINSRQMENIEVNGRNPLDMTKLIPGVVETSSFQVGGVGGLSGVQVNGNRGTSNQLTINGIGDIDTGANGSQNVTVSLDSMSEFKVLSGTYQAEYGRNAGAQIALVTKSGTDQFHGSGYFYHRHEDLNANTWYNNSRGTQRGLYRYNDPGYTIGGPVYIPKLLTKTKDKLFFFWSEEWQQQLVPNTPRNVTLPTAQERQGNFSQTVDGNGKHVTIKDPLTGQPFAGNIIPSSRLYAPGVALMNLFPLPNVSGQVGYNYTSQISGQTPRREDLLRVDYNVTQNIRVFGHFIKNTQPVVAPYGSFVLGINVPVAPINDPSPGYSFAGGMTWILNPTTTNEFNLGMTHNSIDITQIGSTLTRTTSGINLPLLYPSAVQDDYIPGFAFTGGSNMANGPDFTSVRDAPFHNFNTSIDMSDNVTKVVGTHTVKFGGYLQRSRKDQSSFGSNNGFYNFADTSNNPNDTGYGYSNAALGVYQSFDQATAYINGMYRYYNVEGFLQDTWKVTPRLTLDYGLRVSWYQPQYDASLQASTFVLSAWNPAQAPRLYQPALRNGVRSAFDPVTGETLPAYDIGLEVPNTGNPYNGILQAGRGINKYLQPTTHPQWGPRFGMAYDVTGKQNIVIRTGGGIYYDRYQGNRVFDSVRNPPEGLDPVFNNGFASNINPANIRLSPPTVYATDPTAKIPTTYMYQFSIQTRLPWEMLLDTGYVGTQGRHLQDNRNLNPVAYGATFLPQNQDPTLANPNALRGTTALNQNLLRPLTGYNVINLYESAATSNYNALQVSLNKRATTGLFFGISYTWSKVMTNATSDTSYVRADGLTRQADYAPANFDRTQVFAANYVYNLPKVKPGPSFFHAVTNGWQLSGVTQAYTGAPFTPKVTISGVDSTAITGNYVANAYSEGGRVGVIKGCNVYSGSDNPFNRLNTACFTAPQPGSLGLESGLNWLRAPGLINFDMSLQKEFAVKERLRFQFRVDAFNVFNHPNFTVLNSIISFSGAYPNVAVANAPYNSAGKLVNQNGFGTVGTTNGIDSNTAVLPAPPRILQLVVRLQF